MKYKITLYPSKILFTFPDKESILKPLSKFNNKKFEDIRVKQGRSNLPYILVDFSTRDLPENNLEEIIEYLVLFLEGYKIILRDNYFIITIDENKLLDQIECILDDIMEFISEAPKKDSLTVEAKKSSKSRNGDILLSYKREINLNTRSVKDKTKYSRKQKHKNKDEF